MTVVVPDETLNTSELSDKSNINLAVSVPFPPSFLSFQCFFQLITRASFVNSLIPWFFHLLTQFVLCSLIHSSLHTFIFFLFILSFVPSFVLLLSGWLIPFNFHSFIHSFVHSLVCSFLNFIFIYSFIGSLSLFPCLIISIRFPLLAFVHVQSFECFQLFHYCLI